MLIGMTHKSMCKLTIVLVIHVNTLYLYVNRQPAAALEVRRMLRDLRDGDR
jgi:preprotein translocase subunit YajC